MQFRQHVPANLHRLFIWPLLAGKFSSTRALGFISQRHCTGGLCAAAHCGIIANYVQNHFISIRRCGAFLLDGGS
ncbi:MAG: hypothetical protein A3I66_23195 [Burkholderiales bacterium RIFCSPLOWO2_02_FULL_57_36]|nr:MAG: hypothetical protein A3I66_23195 [Burkholderiales bacterium RIFCSPLOWO2_02_FULL_57_36]